MAKLLVGLLQVPTDAAQFQSIANKNRLPMVKWAVEQLARRSKGFDIGIFSAPEYLFAHQNANQPVGLAGSGKYHGRGITEQVKETNLDYLSKLSVSHKNLLLIPGSTAWLKPFDREAGIAKHTSAEKGKRRPGARLPDRSLKARRAILNAARDAERKGNDVQTGFIGRAGGYGGRHVPHTLEKSALVKERQKENIQILRNSLYVIWNGNVLHKYNKIADYYEVLDMASQPSVFVPGDTARQTQVLFGKNFGFEICLDHAYNMLGFGEQKRLANPIDIHVIVSASVGFVNTVFKEGGLYIHASSDQNETSVWRMNMGMQVPVPEDTVPNDVVTGLGRMRYFPTEIDMKLA